MKAKLIFDLPGERKAFLAAAKADDMAGVLFEITYNLRREAERYFVGENYDKAFDFIFGRIDDEIHNAGIIIDDLTE